jgi:hypothetical protein
MKERSLPSSLWESKKLLTFPYVLRNWYVRSIDGGHDWNHCYWIIDTSSSDLYVNKEKR